MSIYSDILTAVKTVLDADAGLDGVTFTIRKRPFFSREHGDSYPLCTISPASEKYAGGTMKGLVRLKYPVTVCLWNAERFAVESEADVLSVTDRREAVRKALHKGDLSGVSAVVDVDYDPSPALLLSGLDNVSDVSVQQFWFTTSEDRN